MAELIAEGMMGENHDFTWKFTNDGTLTISGSGVLKYSNYPSEWNDEIANIGKFQKVVFEEGITEIIDNRKCGVAFSPYVVEFPISLYYTKGWVINSPIIIFFHSSIPPKMTASIDAKIVYVPFDAVETYKAMDIWKVVMAMPPCFSNTNVVLLEDSNFLRVSTTYAHISVYAIDGSLVLNKIMSNCSSRQLIKEAGDYVVVADGKQQKIKILADYIEPEKKD